LLKQLLNVLLAVLVVVLEGSNTLVGRLVQTKLSSWVAENRQYLMCRPQVLRGSRHLALNLAVLELAQYLSEIVRSWI
jgi:hypothetical protein